MIEIVVKTIHLINDQKGTKVNTKTKMNLKYIQITLLRLLLGLYNLKRVRSKEEPTEKDQNHQVIL